MTRKLLQLVPIICLAGSSTAETLNTDSVVGPYHLVQLEVATRDGMVTQARNLSGTLTFDGQGLYSFSGEETVGTGKAAPFESEGTYEITPLGEVKLANPLHTEVHINAKLGADRSVILGTSTEGTSVIWDLFVAVRAAEGLTSEPLQGDYTLATLVFPGAEPARFGSGLGFLANAGGGRFASGSITGRSRGVALRNVEIGELTYSLTGDGSGSASFESDSELLSSEYKIFTTADGAFLLGHSSGASRDILIGIRNNPGPALNFQRRYWIAELNITGGRFSSSTGALLLNNPPIALLTERVRMPPRSIDFTGLNFFEILENSGRGWLADRFLNGDVPTMSLGAADASGNAAALVGAEFAPFDQPSAADASNEEFGIYFAVEAASFEMEGFSVDPAGVVNGASFALQPNPIAPGAIVSIFGEGFAALGSQAAASEFPLPTELLGSSVTIEGIEAPLYFVSERQINLQVPFGLAQDRTTLTVRNGDTISNVVEARTAPTSPGVFSFVSTESFFSGVVTHANGELVTANNPASLGETVVIYATGLGATDPPVQTGTANPADPIAWATDQDIGVFFSLRPANVLFAGGTPGFAGLYQINATIPLDTPTGLNIPLAIQTTNALHDQVDIPVAGTLQGVSAIKLITEELRLPPRARR